MMQVTLDVIQKVGVEAFVNALPEDEVEGFLIQLRMLEDAEKFGRFHALFPDTGPLRREGYTKHLEFFKVGRIYRERCFMAGNRCSGPWSFIETAHSTAPVLEAWTATDGRGRGWDGVSECDVQFEGGFLKGIEPAFRLVMDNGHFFDCSAEHQLLTAVGWRSLDHLVSRSSGLRSWHKVQDYQAHCETAGYLGDAPLRSVAGIDLTPPLSPDDAQRPGLIFELGDEEERTLRHIRGDPAYARLSNPDDLRRHAGLFVRFAGPSSSTPALRLTESSLTYQRLAAELGRFQGELEWMPDQSLSPAREGHQTQSHAAPYMPPNWDEIFPERPLSCAYQSLGGSVRELYRGGGHIEIFYPSAHTPLVGGARIVAIVPIGYQPIIDATVPKLHNYKAAGAYHHNTGKTVAGSYEVTCHLTGEYPGWWEGRRFNGPVKVWAAGKTNETTRDILQSELLGNITFSGQRKLVDGSGIIQRHLLGMEPGQLSWKAGVADLVDTVKVKHKTGGWSELGLKSYQQGRGSFEGTARHVIWFDEEPPMDVYGEALIRTATTKGIIILTFTPLEGMSDVVQEFLPREMRPGGGS